MESKQRHFVLVHGAGLGAWSWERVVPGLENAGHRVTTLDLFGAGESPFNADDCTSFEHYNQPLEDLFKSFADDEKFILVGHSLGGMNITYMSEHFPKKKAVAVYLSAFMPAPGERSNLYTTARLALYIQGAGGPPTAQAFSPTNLKEYFLNQYDPEDQALTKEKLRPWPYLGTVLAPIKATQENYGSVPKVFVLALGDKAICPATARKMIQLNPPNEVIDINTDHFMLSLLGTPW